MSDSGCNTFRPGPCANCGKELGGWMGDTAWRHDLMCCSQACGRRLAKKLEHGMLDLVPEDTKFRAWFEQDVTPERVLKLRTEIRRLRRRVKWLEWSLKPIPPIDWSKVV